MSVVCVLAMLEFTAFSTVFELTTLSFLGAESCKCVWLVGSDVGLRRCF